MNFIEGRSISPFYWSQYYQASHHLNINTKKPYVTTLIHKVLYVAKPKLFYLGYLLTLTCFYLCTKRQTRFRSQMPYVVKWSLLFSSGVAVAKQRKGKPFNYIFCFVFSILTFKKVFIHKLKLIKIIIYACDNRYRSCSLITNVFKVLCEVSIEFSDQ